MSLEHKRRKTRQEIKISFPPLERFALWVTHLVGTLGFFFVLSTWTIGWVFWNLYAPVEMRFDPAPAFVVWLVTSNIIQLILLPLIMVGQNLEGKFADKRAQEDFEINQKAEQEIEIIMGHLERQNELLAEISKKVK